MAVLTDAELWRAYRNGHTPEDGLRCVERAMLSVMESRAKEIGGGFFFITDTGMAKRERAAWDAALGDAMRLGGSIPYGDLINIRDRRYPLPTRHRSITLSSGERVEATEPLSRQSAFGPLPPDPPYVRLNATSVLTAADIAALAELIAKPTEPCE